MSSDGMGRWSSPEYRAAVARENEAYESIHREREAREEKDWQQRAEKAESLLFEIGKWEASATSDHRPYDAAIESAMNEYYFREKESGR